MAWPCSCSAGSSRSHSSHTGSSIHIPGILRQIHSPEIDCYVHSYNASYLGHIVHEVVVGDILHMASHGFLV
uniref:Uncharacterized protein n=1 Tax=Arundo donax TaxID=35708 RepID=A0A0A9AWD7_ARUDO